uniref:AD domain-containing protein n=1 Tax=Quercus lobata TaxID=97700 RepID=A0A7N2R1U3_QUELO
MPKADTSAFTHYKRQMLRKDLPPFINASPLATPMSPPANISTPPPLTLTIFCEDNLPPEMERLIKGFKAIGFLNYITPAIYVGNPINSNGNVNFNFSPMLKRLPVRWDKTVIVVMNAVRVSSPYLPESVSGGTPAANDRVKKVLEFVRKRLHAGGGGQ